MYSVVQTKYKDRKIIKQYLKKYTECMSDTFKKTLVENPDFELVYLFEGYIGEIKNIYTLRMMYTSSFKLEKTDVLLVMEPAQYVCDKKNFKVLEPTGFVYFEQDLSYLINLFTASDNYYFIVEKNE